MSKHWGGESTILDCCIWFSQGKMHGERPDSQTGSEKRYSTDVIQQKKQLHSNFSIMHCSCGSFLRDIRGERGSTETARSLDMITKLSCKKSGPRGAGNPRNVSPKAGVSAV